MPILSRSLARSIRVVAMIVLCCAAGACRPGTPVVDAGSKPPTMDGTISGMVSGPEGTSAIVGRTVTVVEVGTGQKYTVKTAANGGYTIKVPAGKYRFELELLAGESIVKGPTETTINSSDLDAQRDFVVSQTSARP